MQSPHYCITIDAAIVRSSRQTDKQQGGQGK